MGIFGSTTIGFADKAGNPQLPMSPPPADAPAAQVLDFAAVIGLGHLIGQEAAFDAVALYNRAVQAYHWKWDDYEPYGRGPSKPWPPVGA